MVTERGAAHSAFGVAAARRPLDGREYHAPEGTDREKIALCEHSIVSVQRGWSRRMSEIVLREHQCRSLETFASNFASNAHSQLQNRV